MPPRIMEVRICGLRALADVIVPLDGLTVLIGDNGTGKSSVLEALRIVSLAARGQLLDAITREHVLTGALNHEDNSLLVQLRVRAAHHNVVYSLRLMQEGSEIQAEAILPLSHEATLASWLRLPHEPRRRGLYRKSDRIWSHGYGEGYAKASISPELSMLEYFGHNAPFDEVNLIRQALDGIDAHLPFEVSASWALRAAGRRSAMREPALVEPSKRLARFGSNLANVYQTLKNSGADRWRETLELLQLGIGPHLRDVMLGAAAGGHLNLSLELAEVGHVPAYQLADGQLTYLAFVALVQLDEGRSLLSFDEPEQHLHPALLGRVTQLLAAAAERYPVILATHSDRLLDFLPDPVAAVRVCELDAHQRAVLRGLDQAQLDKWLRRYRGLGELRAAGQLRSVLAEAEAPTPPTRDEGSAA